jgi:assimilatory nitrate reductase catalytic subunit
LGRLLLSPQSTAPKGFKSRGRAVCNCFNISETEIVQALDEFDGPPEAQLAALQGNLKCGTNCGSCIPELKKIVLQRRAVADTAA